MRDAQIFQQLRAFDWSKTAFLHCYLPITDSNEFDTGPFISWIWTHYPAIQVVSSRSDFKTHQLTHYALNPDTPLVKNAWGIPEPYGARRVPVEELDAVLVPLLVVDANGNRVGYGKGFYDRFLAACRPGVLKMGVSYFSPVDSIPDVDAWDVPVDGLFFPEGTCFFQKTH